ncbi:hypothetical protein K2173_011221 [Erythroxylum novogranatense]|uniref:K Homology domain-containing protein n=1 Tax=Erythroxylum novogranatense TaxID=1862640 RepID=A0AAV8TT34_9ROSI|nr:hypothetical protein K2173_011221 [Erythroxylum novogranatense]
MGSQDSEVQDQHGDPECSKSETVNKNAEILELEKQEVIGEILKLNPSYKAPPDYKALMKEARVPIPVKEYPRYNFLGLIFGSQSESQKRLESETGAKVQVYGIKANTGEKIEISPSNENEIRSGYEDLNIHVSADAFEKVDAAVSLIESLLSSVLENLAAGDNTSADNQNKEASTTAVSTGVINSGEVQSVPGPTQNPQQGQFHYQGLWFPPGTPQSQLHPPSGFIAPQNSLGPTSNNPLQVNSYAFNPSGLPSLFGPRPVSTSASNSTLTSSLVHSSVELLGNPYPSQNFPVPSQSASAQANNSTPLPLTVNQPLQTGILPVSRPLMPSLIHPTPNFLPNLQPGMLLNPVGSSSGWSGGSVAPTLSPVNMGQTPNKIVPLQGQQSVVPPPVFPSSARPSNVQPGLVPPQSSNIPLSHPNTATNFAPVPHAQVGTSLDNTFMGVAGLPNSNPIQGFRPTPLPITSSSQPMLHSGIGSFSANRANFTPIRPLTVTPRVQHSRPGEFTFQSHHSQDSTSQLVPRLSSQPAAQSSAISRPAARTLVPQAALFPSPSPNAASQPGMHLLARPQISNQIGQAHPRMSAVPFTGSSVPPRLPTYPNPPVASQNAFSNLSSPFPSRPGNLLQPHHSFQAHSSWRGNVSTQQFNNNPILGSGVAASGSGVPQIYDPFSPTSVSVAPQQQGGHIGKGGRQENDPEYEDLMASVGVK